MMFHEIRKRAKKVGQPPGTLMYTGEKKVLAPKMTMVNYDANSFNKKVDSKFDANFVSSYKTGITWINVEGLQNVENIQELAAYYHLHPLTVEDILNNEQRSKVEEFDDYLFITMKMLLWVPKTKHSTIEEFSLVIGKNFLLTFQDCDIDIFDSFEERLKTTNKQRIQEFGSPYLAYCLMDIIVDHYFLVLEKLGDQIENIEQSIISAPTRQCARTIYSLKRQMLMIRKGIWPIREVLSHLLQINQSSKSSHIQVYLRDVYDHAVQAIDTLETFRDMLSGMLDIYLSSLTARMNEIMKVLTMIATVFIPITFVASIYGMNFDYMPELHWHYGYYMVLAVMSAVVIWMVLLFKRKNWL